MPNGPPHLRYTREPVTEFERQRKELGWNTVNLAHLFGVDNKTIRNFDDGRRRIPPAVTEWMDRRVRDFRHDPPPQIGRPKKGTEQ